MSSLSQHFDAIILGAGAAGLMCALTAGARGRRVLLLDHAPQAGAKILISGGGRCNFTHLDAGPERFLSANPRFAISALRRYTPQDFVALVRKHGIGFHEKTPGQLFCDTSARAIVGMLLAECAAAQVRIELDTHITDVTHGDDFRVQTTRGTFHAPKLVLATGGLSIPKMGATGFAHDLARRFGLDIITPTPALVPLTFADETLDLMRDLSGVAVDVSLRCGKRVFEDALLFTHRGLSGPSVLQISSYWQPGEALSINLLPGQDAAQTLITRKAQRPKAELRTILAELLPQRLAHALITAWSSASQTPIADTPNRVLNELGARLNQWQVHPNGTEGFAKAEVTRGGIDTKALSSRTMMANAVPGLYAIGEAVDVTGWLGGYNFQWAWSSGWSAAHDL